MRTNINLPKVLSFESEDHLLDFIEAAAEIIPKIKYQHIGGEGYSCIIYTRKDKKYRSIMIAATAPTTITDTPIEQSIVGEGDIMVRGEVLHLEYPGAYKDKNLVWVGPGGKVIKKFNHPDHHPMPTESIKSAK